MPSKDGWTHERNHDRVQLGKKQYRNMEEWSRGCAVCGNKFFIFVRTNAEVINSSFGLRTCREHRGQKPNAPGDYTSHLELEQLRAINATMKQELAELYPYSKQLFDELQIVKARLAIYELQPAMQAVGCEAVQNTTNSFPEPPAQSNLTFPWSRG